MVAARSESSKRFWCSMAWKVAGEAEFQDIMEAIDAEMRRSHVPIHLRDFRAITVLRKRLGVSHPIVLSDLPERPRDGSYQGRDLTKRVRLPRGIGVTRLRDAPVEWSRQHAMLGLVYAENLVRLI
jgi:hypothetical protein